MRDLVHLPHLLSDRVAGPLPAVVALERVDDMADHRDGGAIEALAQVNAYHVAVNRVRADPRDDLALVSEVTHCHRGLTVLTNAASMMWERNTHSLLSKNCRPYSSENRSLPNAASSSSRNARVI